MSCKTASASVDSSYFLLKFCKQCCFITAQWIIAAGRVCRQHSLNFVTIPPGYPPLEEPFFKLHPPETNPPENRGFSKLRRRTRRSRFPDEYVALEYNCYHLLFHIYEISMESTIDHITVRNLHKDMKTE